MSAAPPQTERKPAPTKAGAGRRKVALVSGASRGIGRATAIALAKAGYDVAVVARDKVRLDEVRSEISKHGVRAFAVEAEKLLGESENVRHKLTAKWIEGEALQNLGETVKAKSILEKTYKQAVRQEQKNIAQSASI